MSTDLTFKNAICTMNTYFVIVLFNNLLRCI